MSTISAWLGLGIKADEAKAVEVVFVQSLRRDNGCLTGSTRGKFIVCVGNHLAAGRELNAARRD